MEYRGGLGEGTWGFREFKDFKAFQGDSGNIRGDPWGFKASRVFKKMREDSKRLKAFQKVSRLVSRCLWYYWGVNQMFPWISTVVSEDFQGV